jgi:hypothetical protein
MAHEIGWPYFTHLSLERNSEIKVARINTYLQELYLGLNDKIERLPESMPSLQTLDLVDNNNFDLDELKVRFPSANIIR